MIDVLKLRWKSVKHKVISNMSEEFQFEDVELLRFTTAGSVDDGKSTLIGRLLYDSKSIYEDVIDAVEQSSKRAGKDEIDLSMMTDGLKSEREQGITIDVAYRYFSTPKRRFIIADTPGHEQYTRNMVTGASTANLAIILIDARHGVLPQSRRHAILASLLGIPHVVVAINKMDLKDWSEERFREIEAEFAEFIQPLGFKDVNYIPISALLGDNVVNRSENMKWYDGPTLMYKLEHVHIEGDSNYDDFRLPVQNVIRPDLNYRGFAGQIASGTVKVGDEVMSLPSRQKSKIKSIDTFNGQLEEAFVPQSIAVTLEDEIDTSRGNMIVKVDNQPKVSSELVAHVCWMDEKATLQTRKPYTIRHTSNEAKLMVTEIDYRLDINNLEKLDATELNVNEIGVVKMRTSAPLPFDAYKKNRITGSFIIVDPFTNNTVGAGMIIGEVNVDQATNDYSI